MSGNISETEWKVLLQRIKDGRCTPFLGAGACYGALPLGGTLARQWAKEFDYPMDGADDLVKVSQYVALLHDQAFPKEEIGRLFAALRDHRPGGADVPEAYRDLKPPDFDEPDEPHGVLARLPFPVYMTTNYDDFMTRALQGRMRDVRREHCRWAPEGRRRPSVFEAEPGYAPTPARPLVFHLHGRDDVPGSLVLTEDDYLGFLAGMVGRQDDLIPALIREAVADSSL
ncbi:MAG: SIR2 family protein, partial [Planctomycetia bacterium]|nr:SIR2 family protein [Planctomycetia bacterium]